MTSHREGACLSVGLCLCVSGPAASLRPLLSLRSNNRSSVDTISEWLFRNKNICLSVRRSLCLVKASHTVRRRTPVLDTNINVPVLLAVACFSHSFHFPTTPLERPEDQRANSKFLYYFSQTYVCVTLRHLCHYSRFTFNFSKVFIYWHEKEAHRWPHPWIQNIQRRWFKRVFKFYPTSKISAAQLSLSLLSILNIKAVLEVWRNVQSISGRSRRAEKDRSLQP